MKPFFEYPEENDADQEIRNCIDELEDIVNQYVSWIGNVSVKSFD